MINNNLLIVDDDENILNSLKRFFFNEPFIVFTATSAEEALKIIHNNEFAVILSDLKMPEKDGLTFLEEVRHLNRDSVQILMTGYTALETALEAVNRLELFKYIIKPWNDADLLHSVKSGVGIFNMKIENRRLTELIEKQNTDLRKLNSELEEMVRVRTIELEEAVHEGILMLAAAGESKDECSGDHIHRILDLTHDICKELGLSNEEAFTISSFSMIHDLGKINVPEHIFNKRGVLDSSEWELMKDHTVFGERILGDKPYYEIARQIARSHHENWDGSGYPDGLKGKKIPLPARIVAVADVYDALISARPYKEPWPVDKTVGLIKEMAGKKFDPEIVDAFLGVISKKNNAF